MCKPTVKLVLLDSVECVLQKLKYSQNWYLDRSKLDSILQKIAAFDYKNDGFLRFYGELDSFFVKNGLLKYYLVFSFDCMFLKI